MTCTCRKISAFLLAFLFCLCTVSAKKKKIDEDSEIFQADESQAVKIAVPLKKSRSFFSSVDSEILNQVQFGSPKTLSAAISSLKKKKESASDAEKVLLYIAQSIMKICWPSENYTEELVSAPASNDYVGILESVSQGLYDMNSSTADFFTFSLPSLVLLATDSRNDFYAEAKVSLEASLESYNDSVYANYLYGLLCERLETYDSALNAFKEAASGAPESYEIQISLARNFYKSGMYSDAFSCCEKLLSINPQDRAALKLCAEIKYAEGDFAACELYVNRVLQVEPENRYFVLFRTRLLMQKGEYIRAASLLDVYARADTTSRDYLVLRYKLQKEWNKNISAATATIEAALALYPDDYEVIELAAALASETGLAIGGKTGDELADVILQNDPQNVNAIRIKVNSMIQKKQWNEAYAASSALMKMNSLPPEVVFSHITICLSCGRKEEAWKIVSKLYSEDSSNEDVAQAYVHVLVSTSRMAEALKVINKLLPTGSSKMKSFLYYEKSFIDTAEAAVLADLRSSLTMNPRNKDALFKLYSIYFDKKEYRKAQYYLKQVVAISPNDESLLLLNQQLEQLLK